MSDRFLAQMQRLYALEVQSMHLLERQCDRVVDFGSLQARLRVHIAETKRQLKRLAWNLNKYNRSPLQSENQPSAASVREFENDLVGSPLDKIILSQTAFENLEIAEYNKLLEEASLAEDHEARSIFALSLEEERAMARVLASELVA